MAEILDLTDDLDELEDYDDEAWTDADSDVDFIDADSDVDFSELAETLRDVLAEDYSDADPEDLEEALAEVLESMSPAEAFNFGKALKQIQRSAKSVVANPLFKQVAGAALPIAGGAVGTLLGGPVGTALGSSLGNAAAGALGGGRPAGRGRPAAGALSALTGALPGIGRAVPAVAGGSAAAAQGLVLTQQPDVLKSLLALSMGQHGQKAVNGVPVAKVMNMLSSVFGQAAADADELMYLGGEGFADSGEVAYDADTDESYGGRELYTTLLDADNAELADAMESL
jgi:hypothetical protein